MPVVEPEAGGGDQDGPVAGVRGQDEEGGEEEEEGGEHELGPHCKERCGYIEVLGMVVGDGGRSAREIAMQGPGLSEQGSAPRPWQLRRSTVHVFVPLPYM